MAVGIFEDLHHFRYFVDSPQLIIFTEHCLLLRNTLLGDPPIRRRLSINIECVGTWQANTMLSQTHFLGWKFMSSLMCPQSISKPWWLLKKTKSKCNTCALLVQFYSYRTLRCFDFHVRFVVIYIQESQIFLPLNSFFDKLWDYPQSCASEHSTK